MRALFLFSIILCSFSFCSLIVAQDIPCQTPNHQGLIIFEPIYWLSGEQGTGADLTREWNHYGPPNSYEWPKQENAPNPGPDTDCNLEAFLILMELTDIGILYINSHGNAYGISFEFHANVASRDEAYRYYIETLQIPEEFMTTGTAGPFYTIGLTCEGIQHYCTNLTGALVFADACYSAALNPAWGAKIALGWDGPISILSCEQDNFFLRMLGHQDRAAGNTNYCREAHDAASLTHFHDTHLICYQPPGEEIDIVLSPIILEHRPGYYYQFELFYVASLKFDCIMYPHEPASEVIQITGPPNIQVQDVYWVSDHELRCEFEPIRPECWIDFTVDPAKARSFHNESQLDGNTDPPSPPKKNGVAPNQDHFNWTSSQYYYQITDFENGLWNNRPIGTTIPGLDFSVPAVPWNYIWVYKQPTFNSNVYPYSYSWPHPIYWYDGRFAAWIGEEAPIPLSITATMVFTHATASLVCMG
jgi:hypothetical protein